MNRTDSRQHDEKDELAIIQQTDVDAKVAKRSAAAFGYLNDPFIEEFVKTVDRKPPIINRGTYVRTRSIDRLIEAALSANTLGTLQIVSLGAGTDTRFFNLQTRLKSSSSSIRYHEFDFQKVASAKAKIISLIPRLRTLVHHSPAEIQIDVESGSVLSPTYCLHPIDIRDLPRSSALPQHLDPNIPTLFISECCLIYMDQESATGLLEWISKIFGKSSAGVILYEPIGGHDAFGRVMVKNLAARGINLKTLSAYPTLQNQSRRLKDCGFVSGHDAIDISFAHDHWMGKEELRRIGRLEMLDEMEEWRLLASHYCLAWGWIKAADVKESPFEAWRNISMTDA